MSNYDTVIVDEAARVGPRDLLIPRAQARRRIILVGDDRQLPHLIDEEVVRALEASDTGLGETGAATENDLIKQSMFQYLKRRLAKLTEQDKFPRHVILDQQFRMHPLLGEFVSRTFYEPHKERFRSPSPLTALSTRCLGSSPSRRSGSAPRRLTVARSAATPAGDAAPRPNASPTSCTDGLTAPRARGSASASSPSTRHRPR